MIRRTGHIFERSGLAALGDLNNPQWQEIFAKLETVQQAFLDKEPKFRSPKYKWPRDPLYDWSRVWEYPYAYYHLAAYQQTMPQNSKPIIADVGSGVTFFPFAIARIGCQVICTDIDPICEKDLLRARNSIPHSPGTVDFRLIEDTSIPFVDAECDAVYCISVLEHIPDFEKTVTEMSRILKPGGLCLITCDINLKTEDGLQLDVLQYERLMAVIDKYFIPRWHDRTIHPADLLTTKRSPYPLNVAKRGAMQMVWHISKQKLIKPLLGRKPGSAKPEIPLLAVLGMVLIKKS